jgi:MauM/NapG family ferredoxin protein
MSFGDSDRRTLFRDALSKWAGSMMESVEGRVVQRHYFRPPGALPEVAFLSACTRCSECIRVCPAHAIVKLPPEAGFAAGTPAIHPSSQPCIVCEDMPCAAICPTEALTVPEGGWNGYRLGKLELNPERCITFSGTTCGVCADACPVGTAALAIDDAGHPVIKAEGCVGCGACVRACVTSPSSFTLTPPTDR